jgi:hypothetical protein
MDQFPSKLFNFLRSAVANATDLLLLPPVPGLERPGYNQFAATRRHLCFSLEFKNYAPLRVLPALPGERASSSHRFSNPAQLASELIVSFECRQCEIG